MALTLSLNFSAGLLSFVSIFWLRSILVTCEISGIFASPAFLKTHIIFFLFLLCEVKIASISKKEELVILVYTSYIYLVLFTERHEKTIENSRKAADNFQETVNSMEVREEDGTSGRTIKIESKFLTIKFQGTTLKCLPDLLLQLDLHEKYFVSSDSPLDLDVLFKVLSGKVAADSFSIYRNKKGLKLKKNSSSIFRKFVYLRDISFKNPRGTIVENIKECVDFIPEDINTSVVVSQLSSAQKQRIVLSIILWLARTSYLIVLPEKLFQSLSDAEASTILDAFDSLKICVVSDHPYFRKHQKQIIIRNHKVTGPIG